ncbi:MAG: hypothetical protein ACR2PL_17980 [Dehalococcoidia bacterium]
MTRLALLLLLGSMLGLTGVARAAPASAAGPPRVSSGPFAFYDDFTRLDPTRWHVTDSTNPTEQYGCPGSVADGCLPGNVAVSHRNLQISLPATPAFSGGQIVSTKEFQYGLYGTRLAAGSSTQALNAMFLYSFSTQDEGDVEVTYDGVGSDPSGPGSGPTCGSKSATHQ